MKILILYRKGSASCYHRIFNPFRTLTAEDGEITEFVEESEELIKNDFKGVDLVVFNRHPTIDMEQFLIMKKQYKFKVWVDIDDSWELYEHHYLYKEWNEKGISELIKKSIEIADIVTTTNLRLLRKVQPLNEHCKVIPNAVPFGIEQFQYKKTESSYLRFMYAGGPSHEADLKSIDSFFTLASKDSKLRFSSKFILAGYNSQYIEPSLHKMNYIMSKSPNYETRSALPLHKYMDHYHYCDVSLAPIESNNFNYYKSNLKIIEAGCMKVPIIVSNCFPFLEDEEMANKGVFFCKDTGDWFDITKMLIENPKSASAAGEILYNYVKGKYNLLTVNSIRRQIINSFKNV